MSAFMALFTYLCLTYMWDRPFAGAESFILGIPLVVHIYAHAELWSCTTP
jgi:hypothetical protein